MAYDKDFPADDSYLADFPSNEREQIRAIVEDKIVNAGKVNGLTTSNGSGQVPVSNGTVNTNLNADMLDGHHAEYFSPSGHRHNNASTSSDGFMSAADKTKLDGVATGAEVNQNAFGNVAVGSTTLQADNKQGTLYINAGNNISIAADAANDKLTIGLSGIVPVANNADQVDGYHENSFLRYRGYAATTGEDTLWSQIGIKQYDGKLPKDVSGTYNYGAVVSLPGDSTRLDIWYNHQCSANKDGLWYRSGWGLDQKAWAQLIDSNNYTNYAPTKTGGGASGTWGINISGNAATATKLSTARTIQTNLASTSSASFDGTANVAPGVTGILPVAHGGTGLDHLPYTPNAANSVWDGTRFPVIGTDGVMEIGSMVDFHEKSGDSAGYSLRLASSGGKLLVNGTDIMSYIANVKSQAGVVAGDVSNANAWWVKLGGTIPLIIQGGYNYVGIRTDRYVPFPVAYSRVLSIVGTPVVNAANSSGRGLENIKTYNTTSFVYYSGFDIDDKNLLWLSVGI